MKPGDLGSNRTVQVTRPNRWHVMIVTASVTPGTSIPLATFTVGTVKETPAPDLGILHQSLCEYAGHTPGYGIALQTFPGEVTFYGNVLTPFIGALVAKQEELLGWLGRMHITAARAAVLNFALQPFCPVAATPFLEVERAAIDDLNRCLAVAGVLMEQGNYVERSSDRILLVAGAGVPSPPWFLGLPRTTW